MDDKQRAAGGSRHSDERRAEAMFVGLEAGQFRFEKYDQREGLKRNRFFLARGLRQKNLIVL